MPPRRSEVRSHGWIFHVHKGWANLVVRELAKGSAVPCRIVPSIARIPIRTRHCARATLDPILAVSGASSLFVMLRVVHRKCCMTPIGVLMLPIHVLQ